MRGMIKVKIVWLTKSTLAVRRDSLRLDEMGLGEVAFARLGVAQYHITSDFDFDV